jgi:hypothetical protein
MAFGFEHVGDGAVQRLRELADRVRTTLAAAGIPVSASASPLLDGSAVLDMDTGADEAGGIYVRWRLPRAQHDELLSRLEAGQQSHPRAQYFFTVQLAMRDAITVILNAAGITAVRSEDPYDMDPLSVLVTE